MDIVEAILIEKKKYIVLISGYLWWNVFNDLVNALAKNLKFEVIYINQLLPENMLITSADHINFPVANEIISQKISDNHVGLIIVSYTFPPERLTFYPDFHINITTNQMLLTNLIVELSKEKQIKRLDIDNHISYLTKSWKTNKIGKSIILFPDYTTKINDIYGLIFDSIMDNIMKKLYGEKYEEYKTQGKINESQSKINESKILHISDPTKISIKDETLISDGIKTAKFTNDLDDIIIESDDSDFEINSEIKNTPTLSRSYVQKEQKETTFYDDVPNSIQSDDIENTNQYELESFRDDLKESLLLGKKNVIYIGKRFNGKY